MGGAGGSRRTESVDASDADDVPRKTVSSAAPPVPSSSTAAATTPQRTAPGPAAASAARDSVAAATAVTPGVVSPGIETQPAAVPATPQRTALAPVMRFTVTDQKSVDFLARLISGISVGKFPASSGLAGFGRGTQARVLFLDRRPDGDALAWAKAPPNAAMVSATMAASAAGPPGPGVTTAGGSAVVAGSPATPSAAGSGGDDASFVPVADVLDVVAGMATQVINRRGRRDRAGQYLSLVTSTRTLDLEFPTQEDRDGALEGFKLLLRARQWIGPR